MEFQIKKPEPVYAQLTSHFRGLILAGTWTSGSRLPSIQQLALQFGTNYRTVHTALTPLVREGLVTRVHGSGTFVRERIKRLSSAGIYFSTDPLQSSSPSYQALGKVLREKLSAQKIDFSIWIDPRPTEKQGRPLPALQRAIERKEVQSLLIAMAPPLTVSGLERLPVISCAIGNAVDRKLGRGWVNVDFAHMFRTSLQELRRLGCRTVGLISSIHTRPTRWDLHFEERQLWFYDKFLEIVDSQDMKTRNNWIMAPAGYPTNIERMGYDSFRNLWRQDEHPEGLLVFPDVAARGVATACVEMGVQVPRDLKLVFHCNEGVELLCPLPVSWIENRISRLAEAALELLHKQFNGESIQPVLIPSRLYSLGEKRVI